MKIKLLAIIALATITKAYSQTYGVWEGASDKPIWEINFKSKEKTFSTTVATQSSLSSKEKNGFLPAPKSGIVKLTTAANGGGDFTLIDNSLKITSASGNFPAKFSAYEIKETSPVVSLFFDISFDDTQASNGLVILGIGNSSNPVFSNVNQLTGAEQKGIFAGLQFIVGPNTIDPRYRYLNEATSVYGYSSLIPQAISKSGKCAVEIYCNNSSKKLSYKRDGKTISIPAGTYNIFVNGKGLKSAGNYNIPTSGELPTNKAIDAFLINSSNNNAPTANSLGFTISNVKLGALPIEKI